MRDSDPETPRSIRSRVFSRARDQLENRVTEILAGPLGALGEQLQSRGWLPPALGGHTTVGITQAAHSLRMREVLERDRALAEAQPAHDAREQRDTHATAPTRNVQVTPVPNTTPTTQPPASALPIATFSTPEAMVEAPAPRSKRVCKEPIRTRTMAKLLLSQGHADRALSIYDALISEGSTDPVLLSEAEELRRLQT